MVTFQSWEEPFSFTAIYNVSWISRKCNLRLIWVFKLSQEQTCCRVRNASGFPLAPQTQEGGTWMVEMQLCHKNNALMLKHFHFTTDYFSCTNSSLGITSLTFRENVQSFIIKQILTFSFFSVLQLKMQCFTVI